jgi:hypothetical protein
MLNDLQWTTPLTTAKVLDAVFPATDTLAFGESVLEREVHVIPQGSEPRWIVLGDPHRAIPVLESWRPWNPASRLRWSVVKFAARTKTFTRIPGVQNSVAQINSSYWSRVLEDIPANWDAVIHVGTSSHTRKAILFLIGENRKVSFGAKVPLAQGAVKAICNEAEMLEHLKQFTYLPKVLFRDSARGIAVQSWLDGKPVSRGFTTAHLKLLSILANSGSTVRVSDCRAEVSAELDSIELPFDRAILARGMELLDFDLPLQSFVEHRDFAPWNLKWLPGGELGLLDWEWSVPSSVPWQDVCRFFYLDDVHFGGPGNVWEMITSHPLLLGYKRQFDIPQSALPSLTMRYLLRVLYMDWISGNTRLAEYTFKQIRFLLSACPRGIATGLGVPSSDAGGKSTRDTAS